MRGLAAILAAWTLSAGALAASAHSVYEAAELEIHVVNDEGSDLIEAYGGYDIQDAFVGFAHEPALGVGDAGDGFYVRLELYGSRAESFVPQGAANWSVAVTMRLGDAETTRQVWSTDGTTFGHDFDGLLFEVEERDTHIQRAFLSYGRNGLAPGASVSIVRIESRVDGDLRDVAPGGIPVPGTDGAREYEDPGALEGRGVLADNVTLAGPEVYLDVVHASAIPCGADATGPCGHEVTVATTLTAGSQHVFVRPRPGAALEVRMPPGEPVVAPNGTLTFQVVPTSAGEAAFDVVTDVGGRMGFTVTANGALAGPAGILVEAPPEPPEESPAPVLGLLGAVAVAAALRRRRP
jgi:MYXO-CTERM domain-containing protein